LRTQKTIPVKRKKPTQDATKTAKIQGEKKRKDNSWSKSRNDLPTLHGQKKVNTQGKDSSCFLQPQREQKKKISYTSSAKTTYRGERNSGWVAANEKKKKGAFKRRGEKKKKSRRRHVRTINERDDSPPRNRMQKG